MNDQPKITVLTFTHRWNAEAALYVLDASYVDMPGCYQWSGLTCNDFRSQSGAIRSIKNTCRKDRSFAKTEFFVYVEKFIGNDERDQVQVAVMARGM